MNIGNYISQLSRAIQYKKYSKNTEDSYVAQVSLFLKYFEPVATKPSEISEKQIKDYLSEIPNNASHRAALCAIKFFYIEVGHQPKKLDRVDYPKKHTKIPIVYSIEEIQKLFEVCENLKHKVILILLYSTGLRISELLNLKWENFDRSRGVINILNAKGNKDRQVMLSKEIIPTIEKYALEYKPKVYVLNGQFEDQYSETSVSSVLKKLAKKAGIKKRIYPHLIRHTSFTHMIESGIDIYNVQKLAGHSSSKTTQIYLHTSTNHISKIQSPIANITL